LIADRAATTAWEVARDDRSDYLHPNQKPVELAEIAIRNSSQPGAFVLDPFSGSGSTLMACENLGRRARVFDLEPKWVAVAIERWHEQTKETPTVACQIPHS
jgi:DNA modification methylase